MTSPEHASVSPVEPGVSEEPERGRAEPPLLLPRGLIFLAFLWLVASWGLAIGFRPPLHPSPASYEPGVKIMNICLMVGLIVGWPLYRLSQPRSPWPIRQTMLDLMVMLSMVQVVVWPLRLVTTWTRGRTAAIDLALILWALIAAALVAVALGSRRSGARTLAMAGCVVLCIGGPVIAWLGMQFGVDLSTFLEESPLMLMHTLGDGKGATPAVDIWHEIMVLAVAAAAAWLIVCIIEALRRRGSSA